MPNLRPARFAGFTILVLLVLSNLVLPAGAHVTSSLSHLQGHLDPRYINVNEMAANANLLDGKDSSAFLGANAKAADANLLDGQDSTAFLGANAKASDADLLDGQNSTAFLGANAKAADADLLDGIDSTFFVQGPGRTIGQALALAPRTVAFLGPPIGGFLQLSYLCPASPGDTGVLAIDNVSGSVANVFVESGTANPSYTQMHAGALKGVPAAGSGDSFHIQAQGARGVLTVEAATVHRASNCHAQAQGLLTS